MKKILLLLITVFSLSTIQGQNAIQYPKSDTTKVDKVYPYVLPIWGQKLTDRNIKFQLPFGLNANYIYSKMDLEMTEFSLDINGKPLEGIGLEELGFQDIIARTGGINIRADVWVLPFLNFYGLYTSINGSTQVSMVPFDTELIELDPVPFKSDTWGGGMTLVYGWNDYFVNVDANITSSSSDILEDNVGFLVASARIGRRVTFDNGMALAVYIGVMYKDFVGHEANNGNVMLDEYIPGLRPAILTGIENRITRNEDRITWLEETQPDNWQVKKALLERRNTNLEERYVQIDEAPRSQVNYSLKKEIINPWSTQVGFNWELSESWMYRTEFGYSSNQTFILTGLQYRFGL